jgi:SOS-response transcriptional repressor LexA
MKSLLSQRLRAARKAITPEITQRDIAKRLNKSPSAVNLWEAGTTEPGAAELIELSRLYNVSCDWLLGASDGQATRQTNTLGAIEYNSVPVVEAAALVRWQQGKTLEALQTTQRYPAGTAAAVQVNTDSMSRICPLGSYVVVSRGHVPESGSIVLAVIGDAHEPVIRRMVSEGGVFMLIADDQRYPSFKLADGVQIIGTVTEITQRRLLTEWLSQPNKPLLKKY